MRACACVRASEQASVRANARVCSGVDGGGEVVLLVVVVMMMIWCVCALVCARARACVRESERASLRVPAHLRVACVKTPGIIYLDSFVLHLKCHLDSVTVSGNVKEVPHQRHLDRAARLVC